ncbi:MAG: PQQ-like beta-propeller repeat protein [Planctomycetales bacterium]
MVPSRATTVSQYLKGLPQVQRDEIRKVRTVIKTNLEVLEFGMGQNQVTHFRPSFVRNCVAKYPQIRKDKVTMHRCLHSLVLGGAVCLGIALTGLARAEESTDKMPRQNWPGWRGPLGTGVAPGARPPLEWSEEKNIRWKIPLPGIGHSTPVVWGDRVFVTTAVPVGKKFAPRPDTAPGAHDNSLVTQRYKFKVLAIDRQTGKLVWSRTVHEAMPHEGGHVTGSLASASPVVDSDHLIASFGSQGLYCLTHEGELVWKKDLGDMQTKHAHGEGSSPVLHGNTLVVNWDHRFQSFVIALDKATGRQLWKVPRDEPTSWSTPVVVEHGGVEQVIVSGTGRVRAYDLATGKVIWECGGLSANVVASPVVGHGMVFAASSYDTTALLAIRLDGASGDITDTNHLVWKRRRGTPYVPSPLLYGKSLYFLRHYQGILTRVDAVTGDEPVGPIRVGAMRDIYASPVGAADRIYITDREGVTMVYSHGEIPRLLALNRLEDSFSASAVLVDEELILRGEEHIYCIAEP